MPLLRSCQYTSIYFLKESEDNSSLNVFTQCTNPQCRNMFITQFKEGATFAKFIKILPTALPLKRTFSNIISELSPNFVRYIIKHT